MAQANDLLDVERGELGYSRWDDSEAGTKYGRWYAAMTGDSYYGESGVPYCAMFQSWCLAQAGVTAAGMPGAYCPSILSAARSAGALVYNEDAQPGDLLLFDWGGDGTPDHIGCCEVNHPSGSYMETIEGNTNNGCVARRTRSYSNIIGVIRPTYSATPSHRHAAVQLYDGNATDAQRLTRSAHDDGSKSYVFTSCGLALDVCNGRGEAGTPVQAYERNDTKAQGWVMEDVENASVYKPGNAVPVVLRSALDRNLVLDCIGGGKVDGTPLQLWPYNGTAAQQWAIVDHGDGSITLINVGSSKALDVCGGGM